MSEASVIQEITTLYMAINRSGIRQVSIHLSASALVFTISVYSPDTDWLGPSDQIAKLRLWGATIYLNSTPESIRSLEVIRDKLDALMLEIPEGKEAAA